MYIAREEMNSKIHTQPNIHSNTIYNSQDIEATKCSSTYDWIKKKWYILLYTHTHIHTLCVTVDYYSALKKNEILSFPAMWMDLENIMLGKMSDRVRQILLYDLIFHIYM